MKLTGELRVKPLFCSFIENEWQFELFWDYLPKTPMVRCMFHKGIYFVGKYEEGVFIEHFELCDFFAGVSFCENPILRGLLEYWSSEVGKAAKGVGCSRTLDAEIIARTIEIWVGKMNDVSRMNILQTGRNGSLSSTGEAVLTPEVNK